MAVNYNDLRRRVALLIDRTDAHQQVAFDGTTVDMLDQFICNAERRVYRDEISRIPPFEFNIDYPVPAGTFRLGVPENFLSFNYAEVTVGDIRTTLERTSREEILTTGNINDRVEIPTRIAYGSNEFVIDPVNQDVTLNVYYYSPLARLADQTASTVDNHFLLNSLDDLIIYYAAVEGALYYGTHDAMLELWEAKAKEIRDAVIMQDRRARQSGGTPRSGRAYRVPPRISPNIGTFGPR